MDFAALAVAAGLAGWTPVPPATPKSAPVFLPAALPADLTVVASPSGALADWDAALGFLLESRVIAVGEKHDEASHHEVQARALDARAARAAGLAVGFEMVAQDQQAALDDFLSGKPSEPDFAAWWKKAWGFDYALYKPVFDVVRGRRLRAYGLNAPRALV